MPDRARLILVADDTRTTAAVVRDAAGTYALDVVAVGSAAEALAALESGSAHLACVEIGRDEERAALALLREIARRWPRVVRLALIEPDAPAAVIETLVNECEVFRVLAKPLAAERLARAIAAAVAHHAAHAPPSAQRDDAAGAALLAAAHAGALVETAALVRELESRVSVRTAQLEHAKRDWESTFDAISTPIALVSPERLVRRANRAYAAVAHRPVREVPGTRCHETLFGRREPCPGCAVDQRGRAAPAGARLDPVRTRDGRLLRASTFPADPVFADGSICVYDDVTDEARQRLAALEAAKMLALAQLAAGVAHEINNPLTGIFAVAQMMAYDPHRSATDQANLALIEESARRCKRIVDDLVAFADQSSSELRDVDVRATLEQTLEQFRATLEGAPGVVLAVDLPPQLGHVAGARDQIRQLLLNLLTNARQALPRAGGRIAVGAELSGGQVRIWVTDDGAGIDPARLPSIFNPLFSTRPVGSGVGLGLAVAYSIARAHGGEIQVESRQGEGSTFTVCLPCRGPRSLPQRLAREPAGRTGG